MTAPSRGGRALRSAMSSPSLCSRCATPYTRVPSRFYSAAAVETATTSSTAPPPSNPIKNYDVRAGLILTRAPLTTRRLTPFENAFFFYQKRLEERLNSPFITNIYYKDDTARRLDWDLKVRERDGTVAKELGLYKGKSSRAWDDELLVGDKLSTQEHVMDSLLKDATARVSEDAEVIPEADVVPVERPVGRESEADKKGDVKRLDRAMDRTLYLVVKGKDGWGFPADRLLSEGETLHVGAERVLEQAAGVNMNTWTVGRVPVAHLVVPAKMKDDGTIVEKGRKTFFLKGRIMAGQADLKGNPLGYTDFEWLTREELEKKLSPEYFRGVKNMLADR
ncbi:50S ribosomal subunit L30 [Sarocladium strictum]